jgi:hypothetical protein
MAAASRPVQPAITSFVGGTDANESCTVPSVAKDSQAKESSIAMICFKKRKDD